MEQIFEDANKRTINKVEDINFTVNSAGIYIIKIAARATNTEILKVKIDQKEYVNKPAIFSGRELKGLKKSVFWVLSLNSGSHTVSLIPQSAGTLEQIKVYPFTRELLINNQAEDGDRRPWITFVLVGLGLTQIVVNLTLKRRFRDSDDVKVVIDGQTKRNTRSLLHKLWYFVASIFLGEFQSEIFILNFSGGVHYLELWADRMPVLKTAVFPGISLPQTTSLSIDQIKEKIREEAVGFGFDPEMILRLVQKESTFDPKSLSPKGAMGLFQLTSITVEQIEKLGYKISDPFDVDQNIHGGLAYFKWLFGLYSGQQDQLEKTLAAWNWGMANFSATEPLNWENRPDMPAETKEFIKYILQK